LGRGKSALHGPPTPTHLSRMEGPSIAPRVRKSLLVARQHYRMGRIDRVLLGEAGRRARHDDGDCNRHTLRCARRQSVEAFTRGAATLTQECALATCKEDGATLQMDRDRLAAALDPAKKALAATRTRSARLALLRRRRRRMRTVRGNASDSNVFAFARLLSKKGKTESTKVSRDARASWRGISRTRCPERLATHPETRWVPSGGQAGISRGAAEHLGIGPHLERLASRGGFWTLLRTLPISRGGFASRDTRNVIEMQKHHSPRPPQRQSHRGDFHFG
jgi:hypothetical protein